MSSKARSRLDDFRRGDASDPLKELIERNQAPDPVQDFGGPTLARRPIAEQVSDRILGMIKSGNLKGGDRLPTEQQMGIAFGISRPPLREALKALTLMGVVESRQGGRYTITDLSPERLIAPFNAMLSVADCDPREHCEARSAIDLQLVRFCTERATDDERQRLMTLAKDGRAFHDDPVAFRLLDIEFHQAINTAARHRMFAVLAQILYDVGLDIRRVASAMPGVIARSVVQHVAIAEAISIHNAEAAVIAYRRHLEHVRDTTLHARTNARGVP